VYARNVDGYTDLTVGRLADDSIEEFPAPDLPEGVAAGIDFDTDAERFAVTVTGRRENTNVHVVDVETGASERWTNASTAGLARESFRTPELVRFESFDGREIPAFLSLPAEAEKGETPVVVDIHGGPESQRRPSFSPVTQYLLDAGYAAFEPNVRGSTGYGKAYTHLDDKDKRMDAVADIERGVAWLGDHSAIDPDRIAVMGGSYGGFMTLAALTEYPDLWAAGVDIVGIADFTTFLENTGSWRRALREAEYGSLDDDRELLESISPLNNIKRIDAPLFVLHGANDPRVPVGEAEQVAARVGEQDVPVETLIFDDEGHGIVKRDNRIEAYTAIAEFLAEHV
jgi:dipeptidyl aminopeptidase/acylaminoacyl peptidase